MRPCRAWLLGLPLIWCSRRELRPTLCPAPELPEHQSALAWQPVAGPGEVRGRLPLLDAGERLGLATVALEELRVGGARRKVPVDTTGRFSFAAVPPGRYRLEVRYVGYGMVRDTVRVPRDSSVAALVALAREHIVLDGCGYAHTYVPRPWWRVW